MKRSLQIVVLGSLCLLNFLRFVSLDRVRIAVNVRATLPYSGRGRSDNYSSSIQNFINTGMVDRNDDNTSERVFFSKSLTTQTDQLSTRATPSRNEIKTGFQEHSANTTLALGCRWGSSVNAVWTSSTDIEKETFFKVMACQKRLYPRSKETWKVADRPPPSSLRCGDAIMDEMRSIVSYYRNLYMIGDSIMRQEFFTMICLLDHSIERADIMMNNRLSDDGPFQWIYNTSENGRSSTSLNFLSMPQNLQQSKKLNDLVQVNQTNRDLFVLNQGAWYQPHKARNLQLATERARKLSEETSATVLWVETATFEWPTSNGEFVPKCYDCRCEALEAGRVDGNGNFTGPSRYLNWNRTIDYEDFKFLYPNIFERIKQPCIPYCLPANWRNDISNGILLNSSVGVVPIWNQLVSFGFPQSRHNGDCTHKSTDALMAIVQQILRSMKHHAVEFSNFG
eukprot:scaffold7755_cov104-Cylindrotheca_fusiformis.AAC.4